MVRDDIVKLEKVIPAEANSVETFVRRVEMIVNTACIKERMGDKTESGKTLEKLLARRESREDVLEIGLVTLYAESGDKDKAFEWLQKAYDSRSPTTLSS